MTSTPSLAVKLYGTDEPVEPRRLLIAGPLTAEFDQGALRFIKINGVEAIRNIGYVVRDKDWGTYGPEISDLEIVQSDGSFRVGFNAICKDQTQEIHYTVGINGANDGTLTFSSNAKTITDFVTNRIGFMVLHPIVGISGKPVTIEHTDGNEEQTVFPVLVDPVQPFMDIRTMTHEVSPGVTVACRMEGDVFETEDQRQWNDASYKTYSRPIAIPYPYTIPAGEQFDQSVTLTISGQPSSANATSTTPTNDQGTDTTACQVSVGSRAQGKMPVIGMGLEPWHTETALAHIEIVGQIGAQVLVCWHDLRAGHGSTELSRAKELADNTGLSLVLEAVLPCVNYQAELEQLAAQVAQADVSFSAVSFSPAAYLKSITPGMQWPDVPALEDIYDAARKLFPQSTLGGGMFSFFPELNRCRPPTDHLDYITHTSNTITHACDDHTVTENLEALPQVITTCRSFAGGKPYRLGPSSIGMRFNPYGSKTMDNPNNKRIAITRLEPRQRGLLNAAWTIGYLAHTAREGIDVVTLHAPTGEFGVINHRQDWSQPWFDDTDAKVYPAFHPLRGIANAAGHEYLPTASSNSHDVECLAFSDGDKKELWIANLTSHEQTVEIDGLSDDGSPISGSSAVARLNADSFERCTRDIDGFDKTETKLISDKLMLSAYEVVRIRS